MYWLLRDCRKIKGSQGWIVGGILGLLPASSWGFVHTTLCWTANYNLPRPSSLNVGGPSTSGFGFLLEYMFSRNSGIEFGALYEPQILNGNISDNLMTPLMYRYWFTQNYTISVGGFATNQIDVIPRFTEPTNIGARVTIGTQRKIFQNMALMVEVGYQYGAVNLSTVPGTSFSKDQAFVITGFRFGGIQRKIGVANNGMKYFLDRPPEFEPPVVIPQELLP